MSYPLLRILTAIIPLSMPDTIPNAQSLSSDKPNSKLFCSVEKTRKDSITKVKPQITPRNQPLFGFLSATKQPIKIDPLLIT